MKRMRSYLASSYVVRDLYKRWQEKEEARNKSQIGGEEA